MFDQLTFIDLEFTIRPLTTLALQINPASTLRGGIGYILKKMLCHQTFQTQCKTCEFFNECDYPLLYEKMDDLKIGDTFIGYSRPFVISTGLYHKKPLSKDETYSFNIRIFGKHVAYVSYMISSIIELGTIGLGNSQQFSVVSIFSKNELGLKKTIYHEEKGFISEPNILTAEKIRQVITPYLDEKRTEIRFLTPVKIKWNGEFQSQIPFPILIQNIMRRAQSILAHHQDIIISKKELEEYIEKAGMNVAVRSSSLTWFDNQRYSGRQKQIVKLSGLVGDIVYEGNLTPYLDLIYLGTFLHMGKQSAFGLGQYKMG